jgi:hypothetical protein
LASSASAKIFCDATHKRLLWRFVWQFLLVLIVRARLNEQDASIPDIFPLKQLDLFSGKELTNDEECHID